MAHVDILQVIGLLALSYLLGSIPWGIVFTRHLPNKDIRTAGSGNIGATNVLRIAGMPYGLLTLAADMLKGAFPIWLADTLLPIGEYGRDGVASMVALATILGHLYPIFLKLRGGGKGVATAAGAYMMISPLAFTLCISAFLLSMLLTGIVSIGSLMAAALLPIATWLAIGSAPITISAFIAAALIFMRHKDNIRRLRSGTENKIGQKNGR